VSILRRVILPAAIAASFIIGAGGQNAFAQAAAQEGQQKNWKDRAEFDLYESITKQTDPNQKLTLLNQWAEKYPTTDFADLRDALLMDTYRATGKGGEMIGVANRILAKDPNNLQALGAEVMYVYQLPANAPADQASAIDKAANQILSNADALFAANKKPANVSDADWGAARKTLTFNAQTALGLLSMRTKQNEQAEAAFLKSLQLDPNSAQVSYWLGGVILAEKNPNKQAAALYHFARAAAYDGPGALAPAGRAEVQKYLEKAYLSYHGNREGLDQLMAQAKANPLPPADFKIVSKADVANAKAEEEAKLLASNPQLALWKNLKAELTGANADAYFNEHMKGTKLPKLTGKLVSATPEARPKQLVLAIEDGTTPDATLNFDAPLAGKMDPGATLTFEGSATAYAASPYMVTFDVDKADLQGWKGAPTAPAHPAAKKAAPKKK
jgi:hypothetical protein